MLPYLALMALAVVFGAAVRPDRSAASKKTYLVFAFLPIFLMAAARSYTVGVDTSMHCRAFTTISQLPFDSLGSMTERYEYGFVLFCKLLSLISGNYQVLIIASSAIICFCAAYFIYRLADEPVLPTVLFLCLLFPNYLNIMREAIAIAIGMLAIVALKDRKTPLFVLLVLLACTFHKSAFALLLLIPLGSVEINWKSMAALLIGGVLLFLFANPVLDAVAGLLGKSSFYDDKFMGSNYFGTLITFLFDAFLVGVFFNYLKVANRGKDGAQGETASLTLRWGMLLWLVFTAVGMKVQIVARFGYYFAPYVLVAMPLVLRAASGSETRFVRFALMSVAILFFLVVETFRPEWHGIVPYAVDLARLTGMLS